MYAASGGKSRAELKVGLALDVEAKAEASRERLNLDGDGGTECGGGGGGDDGSDTGSEGRAGDSSGEGDMTGVGESKSSDIASFGFSVEEKREAKLEAIDGIGLLLLPLLNEPFGNPEPRLGISKELDDAIPSSFPLTLTIDDVSDVLAKLLYHLRRVAEEFEPSLAGIEGRRA